AALTNLAGVKVPPVGGQDVRLGADGRVRTDLTLRALAPGKASVTYGVRTPSGSDRLKLDLPVKARGYDVTRAVTGGADENVTLNVPADLAPGTVGLRVLTTPSLLSAVAPALEYLVGYPYGCTEQTMSRFLPALLAREAL
ncbi:hypothetical protein, partial [Deinococcus pimensis]|uniref:hypothetical protein n=1 Tax=Deinococcus pimensis TaxID=309888 RepID=UPI0006939194